MEEKVKIEFINLLPPDMYHGAGLYIAFDNEVKISYLYPGNVMSFCFTPDSKPHTLEAYQCIKDERSAKLEFSYKPESILCYAIYTDDLLHLHFKELPAI